MNLKRIIKNIFLYIISFILILIIGNALMYLVSSIPSKSMEENIKTSAQTLYDQGASYSLSNHIFAHIDNAADAIILNYSYSINNKDIFYSYLSGRKNYKEGLTRYTVTDVPEELVSYIGNKKTGMYDPFTELINFLDKRVETSANYQRYWHGYLILFRPFFVIFNITQLRLMLCIINISLLLLLAYLCYKKINPFSSLATILSFIAFGIISGSYSLQTFPVFFVTLVASIIMVTRIDKIKNLGLFFFIVGIITNFVDFLTLPLMAWGIPLLLYIAHIIDKENISKTIWYWIKLCFSTLIIFVIGYSLTWLSKWIIYDLLYHEGVVKNGIKQFFYRSSSTNPMCNYSFDSVITYLISLLFSRVGASLVILLAIMHFIIKKYNISIKHKNYLLPFIIIGIMPLIWYFALKNHTILHYFFEYKHMLITEASILFALICSLKIEKREKIKKEES